jgi:hypothetical protein
VGQPLDILTVPLQGVSVQEEDVVLFGAGSDT